MKPCKGRISPSIGTRSRGWFAAWGETSCAAHWNVSQLTYQHFNEYLSLISLGMEFKNRIQEALFSNLSTPPEEVLCPQGSRDFMRSASQHPARKMRNKSGTSMEQTFRVGTEQGSLRPVSGKLLMRMDFPRSEIAHFLQFHNVYIPPKVAF